MSSPAIKLAPERHTQIKAISTALSHQTLSETIAYLINSEIAKGTIPAGIEGVKIEPCSGGVAVAFDDQPAVQFTQESAHALADTLNEFAGAGKRAEMQISLQHNFSIERKGNGVKLTVPLTGDTTKSFPRDLARDLASLLTA